MSGHRASWVSSHRGSTAERPLFTSPEDYDNNLQAISDSVRQIQSNVNQMRTILSQIGRPGDDKELRKKLHKTIENTKNLIKSTATDFKRVDLNYGSAESKKRKKMLNQKLMRDFETWMEQFSEISGSIAEKERNYPLSSKPAPAPSFNTHTSTELDPFELRPEPIQDFEFESDIQSQNDFIAERDREIQDIHSAVVEVNQIFKDVADLVSQQGEMIDLISDNIETTDTQVAAGTEELRQAGKIQRKTRTKMCILLLILVCVAAGLGIVAYFIIKNR
ncbi:hypothetical protein PROFUN_09755 [Planoprotostelium fungivorum]|uniref:t-SNARE coiled-coil homology domain-containing protein n=1 Tax=Planoprotostelium fungivorum TaxID=1890364 RepID=A0A2P6NFB0_9EUKA|nr:hypothetical protein PROFUN_09755 [Planoprotostelium fungivorum]